MSIETKKDWWEKLKNNWTDILVILGRYLPMTEEKYEIVKRLKDDEDKNLAQYLHNAWAAAPDNRSIWENPGWGVLCDLCSEATVLDQSDELDLSSDSCEECEEEEEDCEEEDEEEDESDLTPPKTKREALERLINGSCEGMPCSHCPADELCLTFGEGDAAELPEDLREWARNELTILTE